MPDPLPLPPEHDIAGWNARMAEAIGQSLPMRVEESSRERVVVSLEVTPRTHQPWGVLHGGVSVVLAESAASIGANHHAPPGMVAVGQEINANHLRPKSDGTIRAVAVPVHIGRTSQVWTIEIRDDDGKLVCVSRCTLAVIPRP